VSFSRRLTLLLLGSLLFMLVPLGVFVLREARAAALASFERMALSRLGFYRAVSPGDLSPLIGLAQEFGGYGFLLHTEKTLWTDTAERTLPEAVVQAAERGEGYSGLHGEHFFVLLPMDGAAVGLAFQVEEVGTMTSRLLVAYVLGGLGLFVLVGGVAHWLLRGMARPLESLASEIAGRSPENLTRFVVPDVPELAPTVKRLNELLEQLERALARSQQQERAAKRFAAQASHELRTPLAALEAYLEVLERNPAEVRAQRGARRELARMHRLLEALLTLARLQGRAHAEAEEIDLAEFMRRRFPRCGLSASGCLYAEADLLELTVKVLLENAERHGAPPYRLGSQACAGHVELVFEDSGGGFPEEVLRRWAAREGEEIELAGGLGLAIVQAVMHVHRGRLRLENRSEGGARAVLAFPRR
jgi:signal transduction histidine kinase